MSEASPRRRPSGILRSEDAPGRIVRPLNELVLVRHGETEWTRSGRHTGWSDIPLTDEGRKEAEAVGLSLRGRTFERVLTSPLSRASETARLAGFPDAERRDELREWNYGAYDGRTTPEIRQEQPGWTIWSGDVPEGESADEVAARVDRLLDELRALDGDALVFAHGHLLRVLAARWLGLDPREGRHFALDPGTVSVLGYERETAVVRLWNARSLA
ncbi:MAG TPA: histidine phosphatase family protein [Gaiellaceae bacterium]|nr:histidine phosphatase family protein [Gaiellaceae bacterium]